MLPNYKNEDEYNINQEKTGNRNLFFTILYTILILITLDGFGLFSFASDQMWGPLNTYDLTLLFINVLFALYLIQTKLVSVIISTKHLKYLLFIYLLILLIVITMPLRGPISIIDSARVARTYLIIPLAFLLYYNIKINKNHDYYIKLFLLIAMLTSIQIVVSTFSPEIISSIFPNAYISESIKFNYQRSYIRTSSMIFPHLAAIYLFTRINNGKYEKLPLILFLFFVVAGALQGFRIYLISMLIVFLIILIRNFSFKRLFRNLIILIILGIMVFAFDTYILNRQIYGRIDTAIIEVTGEGQGTLAGRYERDLNYMYPMFFSKPMQGWGFIYHDSEYGRMIGMQPGRIDKSHSLYSVDSGYLSFLIQFGIVGAVIIALCIYKILLNLYRSSKNNSYKLTAFYLWIFLIISLPTHNALIGKHGLLPMCILMALTVDISNINKSKEKVVT